MQSSSSSFEGVRWVGEGKSGIRISKVLVGWKLITLESLRSCLTTSGDSSTAQKALYWSRSRSLVVVVVYCLFRNLSFSTGSHLVTGSRTPIDYSLLLLLRIFLFSFRTPVSQSLRSSSLVFCSSFVFPFLCILQVTQTLSQGAILARRVHLTD